MKNTCRPIVPMLPCALAASTSGPIGMVVGYGIELDYETLTTTQYHSHFDSARARKCLHGHRGDTGRTRCSTTTRAAAPLTASSAALCCSGSSARTRCDARCTDLMQIRPFRDAAHLHASRREDGECLRRQQMVSSASRAGAAEVSHTCEGSRQGGIAHPNAV